ncbi:MAG TPA: hypothetical protein ENH84_00260 [Phycisphaerae bacterium]|nr:hypothetical protein [Phycisphaerae bacterium]
MDKNNESIDQQKSTKQLQEVSRLAELYARHRTAGPFFIWSVIVVGMFVGIRLAIYLARPYVQSNDKAVIGLVLGIMALVLGVTLFFCIDRLGGRLLRHWGQKLFDKDGQVHERSLPSLIPQWVFVLAATAFGICLAGSIILDRMGYLPEKYMQPISAVYVVPFLIVLGLWRRTPVISPVMWLWPVLYTVHAVLVATSAPLFRSIDGDTHIFIATFGYGALIGLLAYVHSRLTLRKLKKLTRSNSNKGQVQ